MFQYIFDDMSEEEGEPLKITESGNGFKMHITLDSHQSNVKFHRNNEHFVIGLSQGDDFMRMIDNGIHADIGHHTTIRVTPTQLTGTKRFNDLTIKERGCRHKTEMEEESYNSSSFFK